VRCAGQLAHAAIDQVAGDGHHVGLQGVDLVDDGLQIGRLDGGADVDVADLDNGESSSAAGRLAMGTLTSTTAAVRRALR
jgi:hypothetical protein